MNDSPPAFSGILGSLRRLADDGLGAVKERIELIAIEVEEEKNRLITLAVWLCAAAVSGLLALGLFSCTIVYFCSGRARPYALVGLTLLYAGVAVAIVRSVRRNLVSAPRIFSATTEELAEDRACLQPDEPNS